MMPFLKKKINHEFCQFMYEGLRFLSIVCNFENVLCACEMYCVKHLNHPYIVSIPADLTLASE